jgi:hypothetical protein
MSSQASISHYVVTLKIAQNSGGMQACRKEMGAGKEHSTRKISRTHYFEPETRFNDTSYKHTQQETHGRIV